METMKKSRKDVWLFLYLAAFAFIYDWKWFGSIISEENMGYYTVNYKSGLYPGGFMGTVMGVLHHLHPFGEYTDTVYFWSKVGLFVYLLLAFSFMIVLYKKGKEQGSRGMAAAICGLAVVFFPMFQLEANFGSLDMYLMIVALVILLLLYMERWMWLIPVLALVGIAIHPAFAYRLLPLLCFLIYRKEKKGLFLCTLCLSIVSFLYFQGLALMQPENNEAFWVLSLDSADQKIRLFQVVLFFVLMSPLLSMAWKVLRNKNVHVSPVFLAGCFLGLSLDFVVKNQPGLFAYYLLVALVILVITQGLLEEQQAGICERELQSSFWWLEGKLNYIWILYPLLFMPFKTHTICIAFDKLLKLINYFVGV